MVDFRNRVTSKKTKATFDMESLSKALSCVKNTAPVVDSDKLLEEFITESEDIEFFLYFINNVERSKKRYVLRSSNKITKKKY